MAPTTINRSSWKINQKKSTSSLPMWSKKLKDANRYRASYAYLFKIRKENIEFWIEIQPTLVPETWKEQTQGVHDNNYGDVLMTGGRKRGEKEGWNKRNFETTTDSFLSATNRIIKYLTNTSSLNWSQGSKTTFQISWSRCKVSTLSVLVQTHLPEFSSSTCIVASVTRSIRKSPMSFFFCSLLLPFTFN